MLGLHKKKLSTLRESLRLFIAMVFVLQTNTLAASEDTLSQYTKKYPFIFHLVQKDAWQKAVAESSVYYPPTYEQDKFTHATANPDFLLTIGNHFYVEVKGDWLCLRMSVETLRQTGVSTIFEGTAPVGDKPADFDGTDSELFPHILGGIHPDAVIQAHIVERDDSGLFLGVEGINIASKS